MGQKLYDYFVRAEKLGSSAARMKLVMLVSMTTGQAQETPDSPELIQKFEAAMKKIIEAFPQKAN
jgi:hypothetical protein